MADLKPRSREVTDGMEREPARAMLRAIGMTDADGGKPQVGVASSWNEVTPCNMPLDRLAKRSKVGVRDAGGFPIEFVTIAVSDGISMGHEGMRGSLVSREIIADSVECVMHAERFDALVTFAGCDKSLPGMLMAAARLNLPSAFLYGGSILPGHYKDQGSTGSFSRRRVRYRHDPRTSSVRSDGRAEGSCAGMLPPRWRR
jgi:dihydroxy-acid dehydratase